MSVALDSKNVFIFLPTRADRFGESKFFKWNCLDFAKKKDCAVLIVSPYYIAKKGLTNEKFFFSVREEAKNVYTVRKYAFFHLRKRILDRSVSKTVYFY